MLQGNRLLSIMYFIGSKIKIFKLSHMFSREHSLTS